MADIELFADLGLIPDARRSTKFNPCFKNEDFLPPAYFKWLKERPFVITVGFLWEAIEHILEDHMEFPMDEAPFRISKENSGMRRRILGLQEKLETVTQMLLDFSQGNLEFVREEDGLVEKLIRRL